MTDSGGDSCMEQSDSDILQITGLSDEELRVCPKCGGSFRRNGGGFTNHVNNCDGVIKTSRRVRSRYRELFFAVHGIGPYPCFVCGDGVTFYEVQVHHRDHDKTNDDPSNLIAMHRACHTKMHMAGYWEGKTHSDEHRAKVAAAKTGLTLSDETKKKISDKAKARSMSAETRERIGAAQRGKPKSEETKRKMSDALRKRHAERRDSLDGGA